MVRTRQFLILTASLFALLFSFVQAQDKKKEADKKAPIAPAEKLAEGWDEIDERLIFLMVRLANTETSLEAVEKTIAASSRKASVKTGDAKRAIGENEKMDRKGGGPMKWSQFYGTTAEKFFYHPTDRNSSYHTVTVLSPQPPQNDNQTAPGIPSRQGLPVHQRPPQFDYIYKANQGAAAKAEAEAGLLKGKVEDLAARRRKLELEQVALWVEIAFRAAAHFELNKKPVFRFEPILAADDPDAKLHADIMKTAAAFMRVALSIVDEAPKDQDGTLVRIKPAISDAREKLNDAWLRLAVDTSDKKTVEGKFAALAKRLDDVSRNLTESYEISVDGDMNADELRKDTFRGQLQGSLVSYAQIVLALDEMATQMRDQWKVKPDLDKPFGTVNLASITPVRSITRDTANPAQAPASEWKQLAGTYLTNDPDRKKLGPLVLEHGQGDIPSISHSDKSKSTSLRSKQVDGAWLFDWGNIDLFVITPQPDGTVVLSSYWKECQAAFSKGALPNRNPDRSFVYFRSDVKTTQVLKDAPNRKSPLVGRWDNMGSKGWVLELLANGEASNINLQGVAVARGTWKDDDNGTFTVRFDNGRVWKGTVTDDSMTVEVLLDGKPHSKGAFSRSKATNTLQGEWVCIAGEENGKPQEQSTVKQERRRLTIKTNSLKIERVGASWDGKFEIDPSNGQFDWIGKGPGGSLTEWIGVYDLDGDTLKLCFVWQKEGRAKRPTEFKTLPPAEPGMAHAFYTFKREGK